MSSPIKLYSHPGGPNPWKVAIVMEELGVPYEAEMVDMAVMHQQPFESLNPNGRVPVIVDPNTNVTLWESGAILEYLLETYDKAHKLHYTSSPEKFHTQQFLHLQVSGQGPYFGQGAWFTNFHPEKVPSAVDRYCNEVKRFTKVLDGVLAKNNGVLVGDKVTYADLAYIPWYWLLDAIDKSGELKKAVHADNPAFSKWIGELNERPTVKKCFADRQKALGR